MHERKIIQHDSINKFINFFPNSLLVKETNLYIYQCWKEKKILSSVYSVCIYSHIEKTIQRITVQTVYMFLHIDQRPYSCWLMNKSKREINSILVYIPKWVLPSKTCNEKLAIFQESHHHKVERFSFVANLVRYDLKTRGTLAKCLEECKKLSTWSFNSDYWIIIPTLLS